ncbi:MAG TPA: RES family NAD+ phosphorylase [Acidobacteriaceae bacterium]|jgi:RES domain-containing protein|nr:RES family NAD+ phosphorylase [Acidobacteriaceae bacterium]
MTSSIYRILRKPFSASPFDGEGSYRFGGRWSAPGARISYASEHLSLAMLEYLVHLDVEDPPTDLVVAEARVPEQVSRIRAASEELPEEWRAYPSHPALHAIGGRFIAEGKAAILIVPSAIVPGEHNWLLNPMHPHFQTIDFLPVRPFAYDPRLLKG